MASNFQLGCPLPAGFCSQWDWAVWQPIPLLPWVCSLSGWADEQMSRPGIRCRLSPGRLRARPDCLGRLRRSRPVNHLDLTHSAAAAVAAAFRATGGRASAGIPQPPLLLPVPPRRLPPHWCPTEWSPRGLLASDLLFLWVRLFPVDNVMTASSLVTTNADCCFPSSVPKPLCSVLRGSQPYPWSSLSSPPRVHHVPLTALITGLLGSSLTLKGTSFQQGKLPRISKSKDSWEWHWPHNQKTDESQSCVIPNCKQSRVDKAIK